MLSQAFRAGIRRRSTNRSDWRVHFWVAQSDYASTRDNAPGAGGPHTARPVPGCDFRVITLVARLDAQAGFRELWIG